MQQQQARIRFFRHGMHCAGANILCLVPELPFVTVATAYIDIVSAAHMHTVQTLHMHTSCTAFIHTARKASIYTVQTASMQPVKQHACMLLLHYTYIPSPQHVLYTIQPGQPARFDHICMYAAPKSITLCLCIYVHTVASQPGYNTCTATTTGNRHIRNCHLP